MTPPKAAEIVRAVADGPWTTCESKAALLHCAACAEALERAGRVEGALDEYLRAEQALSEQFALDGMDNGGPLKQRAAAKRVAVLAAVAKAGEEADFAWHRTLWAVLVAAGGTVRVGDDLVAASSMEGNTVASCYEPRSRGTIWTASSDSIRARGRKP